MEALIESLSLTGIGAIILGILIIGALIIEFFNDKPKF